MTKATCVPLVLACFLGSCGYAPTVPMVDLEVGTAAAPLKDCVATHQGRLSGSGNLELIAGVPMNSTNVRPEYWAKSAAEGSWTRCEAGVKCPGSSGVTFQRYGDNPTSTYIDYGGETIYHHVNAWPGTATGGGVVFSGIADVRIKVFFDTAEGYCRPRQIQYAKYGDNPNRSLLIPSGASLVRMTTASRRDLAGAGWITCDNWIGSQPGAVVNGCRGPLSVSVTTEETSDPLTGDFGYIFVCDHRQGFITQMSSVECRWELAYRK